MSIVPAGYRRLTREGLVNRRTRSAGFRLLMRRISRQTVKKFRISVPGVPWGFDSPHPNPVTMTQTIEPESQGLRAVRSQTPRRHEMGDALRAGSLGGGERHARGAVGALADTIPG